MPTSKYYPALSELVKTDDLPDVLNFIKDGLAQFLEKLFYKDLEYSKSIRGDSAFYSLSIISRKKLAIELPGTGIFIVLNPDFEDGDISSFPITVFYDWKILAYKRYFNLSNFSFSIEDTFNLLLDLLGTSEEQVLSLAIRMFVVPSAPGITPVEQITADVNAFFGTSIVPPPASEHEVSDLVLLINQNVSNTAFFAVLSIYILPLPPNDQSAKLAAFFESFLPTDIESYLRNLFVPTARATFELSAGIEFPRKMLQPVYDELGHNPYDAINTGDPLTVIPEDVNGNPKVLLKFGQALFYADTERGLGYSMELSLSTNVPAQIGNTGLIFNIQNLKIDLSSTSNIVEADADGRPNEFMGVYIEEVEIYLPKKWFTDTDDTQAKIFGNNLLIGTGGISGTIGLQAIGGDNMFWASLGSSDGFKLGFHSFDIQFKQNKVLSSNIQAAMEIQKFVYPDDTLDGNGVDVSGQTVRIGIEGHIHDDGSFNLTASTAPPYPIELKEVFTYHMSTLELGKEADGDFYIGTSGAIEFQGFLKETLKLKKIDIDRLRIYSDGTIELEGGSIALSEPIVLALGPVEITVTAIHYGSHQKEVNGEMRKFNYFGFDGGISVDPLGIEIRGDGVKFYYCTDNKLNKPKPYLHIQTLYLDLTIPASTPVAIINGWLSIPEPGLSKEYAGGIKLQLPQAKISGSADMKLMPKYPAFIIDVSIDLPAPIPLGPIGIYGFRGLLGYRYVAEKEAAGLVSGVNTWYEYYKAPPRGIHVKKFNGPDKTKAAGTPFSLGFGASLGTSADNGTILNIKAMILLSIPSLFMIDGKAAVLSARLGLEDTGEPPFFAFIAVGDNSLELGFGADFKMPTANGNILTLYAEVQAGFFFNDSSKWYVNFGTKTNPITAKVLTLLTIKSYLMLSAKGIEAGARGEFDFKRSYGPIKVHAWAYIEIGGKISFEKPQFGAYMAAGVGADIDIKIFSLYASFDVLFGVEGARPFKIYGEFRLCVSIKILWVFKFKFCGNLSICWEFNSDVNRDPINPLISPQNEATIPSIVKGVNMLSNETFELAYLPSGIPGSLTNEILEKIIPLDTYIDIKTEKGFIPTAVNALIGGISNPPERYTDLVPPEKIIRGKEVRQVKHQYAVVSLSVKSWNPQGAGSWENYNPYKALYPSSSTLDTLKIGQFQKSGNQYNTIRLLATTPFSFTEQGQPGWFIPEQNGITAATLFCEGDQLVAECANFLEKQLGTKYYCYNQNQLFYSNEVAFLLLNRLDGDFAQVVHETNVFNFNQSLSFLNRNKLQIRLPDSSVEITLRLTTWSQGVRIKYYASVQDDQAMVVTYCNPDPAAVNQADPFVATYSASQLNVPVTYSQPTWRPVTRVEIEPLYPNQQQIDSLLEQIAQIEYNNNLIALGIVKGEYQSTEQLEAALIKLQAVGCATVRPATPALPKPGNIPVIDLTPVNSSVITPSGDPNLLTTQHEEISGLKKRITAIEDRNKLIAVGAIEGVPESTAELKAQLAALEAIIATPVTPLVAQPVAVPDPQPCIKDEKICALYEALLNIRKNCLDEPAKYNEARLKEYLACFEQAYGLLAAFYQTNPSDFLKQQMAIIKSFLSRPDKQTYVAAWNALAAILKYLYELGNCGCTDAPAAKCYTLLHSVCWLSLENYQYNINIPGQAAITEDAQATVAGLTQYIQPVWRPDTSYVVQFALSDTVDDDLNHVGTYTFTYGFTTGGPVGFFHKNEKATYGDILLQNGNTLEDANGIIRTPAGTIVPPDPQNPITPHPELYPLTSLTRYIDYNRSYPNADGNLLSSKPLFYDDETTQIFLFYAKAYATHFFHTWLPYNGLPQAAGRIKIVIKDPREAGDIINPPRLDYDPLDTVYTNIPQTVESWENDLDPVIPPVFEQYMNLINANECVPVGGNAIIPPSQYLTVKLKRLKPLKLYTAIVNNMFDLNKNGILEPENIPLSPNNDVDETVEVHRFTFQTSRYASFEKQVNSYQLSDPEGTVTRQAIFKVEKGFSPAEITAVFETILGPPVVNALSESVSGKYTHKFDRIIEGLFALPPMDKAISTEFNVIRNTADANKNVAVLIRNPEPFNNPKMPDGDIADTVEVLDGSGLADPTFHVLFSKDYSQVIIMNDAQEITGPLTIRFRYKIWDGTAYIVPGTGNGYSSDLVGTVIVNNLDIQTI